MVLHKIKIKNFRGFKNFATEKLSQFTIIAGENNAGKTSLLEAIFLLSGMKRMDISAQINTLRKINVVKAIDLHSIFFAQEIESDVVIEGEFEKGTSRQIVLSAYRPKRVAFNPSDGADSTADNLALTPSYKQKFICKSYGKEVDSGELLFLSDSNGELREYTNTKSNESWRCIFMPARNIPNVLDYIKRLVRDKQEDYVVEMLRSVDNSIVRLVVIDEGVYVDTGLSHLLPIQTLGDGLLKIVGVFSAITICKDGGLVCVDEIDNGLHFSAMQQFWQHVTRFAFDNKVQLIATTHDNDFLKAATRIEDDDIKVEFTYLNLVRRDGERNLIAAYPYDFGQYASAIEGGTEVR